MADTLNIPQHAEVFGYDDVFIGIVDSIQDDRIKLTKRDGTHGVVDGQHHYVPLSLVTSVEGSKVRLNVNGSFEMETEKDGTFVLPENG